MLTKLTFYPLPTMQKMSVEELWARYRAYNSLHYNQGPVMFSFTNKLLKIKTTSSYMYI